MYTYVYIYIGYLCINIIIIICISSFIIITVISVHVHTYIYIYRERERLREREREHMCPFKDPIITQRRLQSQEGTPREQGDTMWIVVFDVCYRPVFSESPLGFGVSSGELRDAGSRLGTASGPSPAAPSGPWPQ